MGWKPFKEPFKSLKDITLKDYINTVGNTLTGALGGFVTGGPIGAIGGGLYGVSRGDKPITLGSTLGTAGIGAGAGLLGAGIGKLAGASPLVTDAGIKGGAAILAGTGTLASALSPSKTPQTTSPTSTPAVSTPSTSTSSLSSDLSALLGLGGIGAGLFTEQPDVDIQGIYGNAGTQSQAAVSKLLETQGAADAKSRQDLENLLGQQSSYKIQESLRPIENKLARQGLLGGSSGALNEALAGASQRIQQENIDKLVAYDASSEARNAELRKLGLTEELGAGEQGRQANLASQILKAQNAADLKKTLLSGGANLVGQSGGVGSAISSGVNLVEQLIKGGSSVVDALTKVFGGDSATPTTPTVSPELTNAYTQPYITEAPTVTPPLYSGVEDISTPTPSIPGVTIQKNTGVYNPLKAGGINITGDINNVKGQDLSNVLGELFKYQTGYGQNNFSTPNMVMAGNTPEEENDLLKKLNPKVNPFMQKALGLQGAFA
jgi:hypothetical protein